MPAVITGNAANALPMIMVNTAMPTAYVVTTANGRSSGIQRCAIPETTLPTPAIANNAPSAASICGNTAAQPTASSSRRASRMGAKTGGRSITIPIVNATMVATASDITVTCVKSTSGEPLSVMRLKKIVPSTVTIGMVRAGTKSVFPQRCALASRSSRVPASALLWPSPRILAASTIPITRNPLIMSGRREPKRNVTE